LVLGVVASSAWAERFFLENGVVVQGEVVDESDSHIVVRTEFGEVPILKEDILRVDYLDGPRRHALLVQNPLLTVLSAVLQQYGLLVDYQVALGFAQRFT
jgi:hypothetical protein